MYSNKRNIAKYYTVIATIILSCFLTFGCATSKPQSFEQISYKTLSTAAEVYETTMTAMGDLYRQGKLSEEDKNKVVEAASIYWSTYHSTVLAMDIWMKTKNSSDKEKLQTAINQLAESITEFQQYVLPLFEKAKR